MEASEDMLRGAVGMIESGELTTEAMANMLRDDVIVAWLDSARRGGQLPANTTDAQFWMIVAFSLASQKREIMRTLADLSKGRDPSGPPDLSWILDPAKTA